MMSARLLRFASSRPTRSMGTTYVGGSILLAALALPVAAQQKPALQPQDYGRWETLQPPVLSPFADWVAVVVTNNNEDSELRLVPVSNPEEMVVVRKGQRPTFSADGAWAAWLVDPSGDEKSDEADETPLRVERMALDSRDRRDLGEGVSIAFAPDGASLSILGAPSEDGSGADLRIVSLGSGSVTTFGYVSNMAWHDQTPLLAMTLTTADGSGNGVQVYDAQSGAVRGLHSSSSEYTALSWYDDKESLAILRSLTPAEDEGDEFQLLVWDDVRSPDGAIMELNPTRMGVPEDLMVVAAATPRWSPDGNRVSFGLRPRPADEGDDTEAGVGAGEKGQEGVQDVDQSGVEEAATAMMKEASSPDEDVDLPDVQIWHSNDVRTIPEQIASVDRDENRVLLAVWTLDTERVVQVGTDLLASVTLLGDWRHGIEETSQPYPWGAMFGRPYRDVHVVDLDSGERRLALERVRYSWESPGGRYLLWFDGEDYHSFDIPSAVSTNITAAMEVEWANTQWDTPTDDFLPPFFIGGWTAGDESVLINDQFDVYRVAADGAGGEALTSGGADSVVFRVLDLSSGREEGFDLSQGLLFTTRDEWSEARGYARRDGSGSVRTLLSEDAMFSSVIRADSVDRVLYRKESFEEAPDLFVSRGDFTQPRLVLESNPFQDEYAWPSQELIEYHNADGQRLHGTLVYPVNHDPDLKYPMIVYAYEILSPGTHRWDNPTERDYYSTITWAQQGYFVLLPDIVFRERDPGISLAETMEAAITAVDAKGLVDRDRVGFVGHSWGGYHGAFLGARTNLFAATVAGAPLTDFVSFMGQFHWNQGAPETGHWENGQARMAVPYWEDPDAHERNSPLHGVQDMTTPILMAHGDSDGVVEYFQSTVFYNFVRRAEKPMVLLTYEGEDHGFRKEANQVDYHRRILEWFDHYLRGAEPQSWITDGVSWKDHEAEKERAATKR